MHEEDARKTSLIDVKCCGPHMCELSGPADLKVLSTTAGSPMGPARRNVSLGARKRKYDQIVDFNQNAVSSVTRDAMFIARKRQLSRVI